MMRVASFLAVLVLVAQSRVPFIAGAITPSQVLSSADVSYVGAETVDNSTHFAAQAQFSHGQLTGYVDGGNVLHFVMFGNGTGTGNFSTPNILVASGSSTSVFRVGSGQGAQFTVGAKIHACLKGSSGGTHSEGCEQTLPENSIITNISGDQITVSPAFSVVPQGGGVDSVYEEHAFPILDVTDQGTWNLDPNSATTAPLFHYYDDPYNGKRGWWQQDTVTGVNNVWYSATGRVTSFGIYRHNSLYYLTYYANYSDNPGYHNLIIFDPANDLTYGPFITSATDVDGTTHTGNINCEVLTQDPTNSANFGCGGFISGGVSQMPWGPNMWTGQVWPTTSTTGGFSGATLAFGTTHYVSYYYMGDTGATNHFNTDGSIHGAIRSFRYPTGLSYIYESLLLGAGQFLPTMGDPVQNNGVGSWLDTDRWGGMLYFRGTNKRGAIFLANIAGTAGGYNNADCTTGQHMWYANNGNVFFTLTNVSGDISSDTYLIGNTSNSQIVFQGWNPGTGKGTGQWCGTTIGTPCSIGIVGDLVVNETVRGSVTGRTATVSAYHNNGFCGHGCDATNGFGATGPSVSHKPKTGVFIIYDPNDLDKVRAGTKTDWQTDWQSVIDLKSTYTYPQSGFLDSEAYHNGFFQDPRDATTFYTIAKESTPGNGADIIYKWHINDSAPPTPTLWELAVMLVKDLAPHLRAS